VFPLPRYRLVERPALTLRSSEFGTSLTVTRLGTESPLRESGMQTAFYDSRVVVFPSESATSLLHFRRQLSSKVVNKVRSMRLMIA
jgi:hypothetical protein